MLLSYLKNGRIVRENSDTRFDMVCDICVVGLGTAGSLAAISAAESGASVIGVEKMTAMGGMGTLACVWDYYYGSSGGRFTEIDRRCLEITEAEHYLPVGNPEISINGAVKQQLLEEAAMKAGANLLYEATLSGVLISEESVVGIELYRGGKFVRIKAKVVIDSTGNASVCRFAGCAFNGGRIFDNIYMNSSLPQVTFNNGFAQGTWSMCGRIDGYSEEAISRAVRSGLKLRNGDGKSRITRRTLFNGTLLGIREAPTISSEDDFTLTDYANGKKVENPLFYACGPLDNTNHDIAFENDIAVNYRSLCDLTDYAISFGVSREMLLPKGLSGIIVACRSLGCGHDMAGMLRMKRDMQKLGEAAGVLASESIKQNKKVKDTDLTPVLDLLIQSGCLDKANDYGLSFAEKQYKYTPIHLPCTAEEYEVSFGSDEPGIGAWAYFTLSAEKKAELRQALIAMLNVQNKRVRFGAATALGMCGDMEALTVLREMFYDKEPLDLIPKKISSPWAKFTGSSIHATVLLGRLCDESIVEDLFAIIDNKGVEFSQRYSAFGQKNFGSTPTVAFEYAAAAIVRICASSATSEGVDKGNGKDKGRSDLTRLSDKARTLLETDSVVSESCKVILNGIARL